MSDPRSYDRARIDRWKLAEAAAEDNGKCGQPSPKPPGGAPRGERTAIHVVRCDTRLVSVVRRASQARSLNAPSRRSVRPFIGAGRREDEKRGKGAGRAKDKVPCVGLFDIVR